MAIISACSPAILPLAAFHFRRNVIALEEESHARDLPVPGYGDDRAVIGIDPLEIRGGQLPPRVLGLVTEWADMHQQEILENWTTLATAGTFKRIDPLV